MNTARDSDQELSLCMLEIPMTDRAINHFESHTGRRNARPTIGFFIHSISETYGAALWPGIMDGARDQNADTICFQGSNIENPNGFQSQANVIYQLAHADNLDGAIFGSAPLSFYVNESTLQSFADRFRALPRVSLGVPLKGISSLTVENYQGMRDVVSHLITAHGKQRIAYIGGPSDNAEAQLRYRAYKDALTEHGIPLDPSLVSAPSDWSEDSGRAVLSAIIDQRGLQPGTGFDAVAASNDETAIAAITLLQERGFLVPNDVAVTGFDGFAKGEFCSPPLTTVRQPAYEQAYAAVEMVLAQLRGETVPLEKQMSTVLVIRQSCGCLDPMVIQAAAGSEAQTAGKGANGENLSARLEDQHTAIQAEMNAAAASAKIDPLWLQQLMRAFAGDITGQSDDAFLTTLSRVIHRTTALNVDLKVWHDILSAHRRRVVPLLLERKHLCHAEDLWQQARVIIAQSAYRSYAAQQTAAVQQANTLRQIGEAMITTFDLASSVQALSQDLPNLGIPSCYLSLYDTPDQPDKWSNLIFAYNESGPVNIPRGGIRFPSLQLIPQNLRSTHKPFSAVITPLYFREQQLGFVLFETGPRNGMIYESLRGQISSMLQGVMLMQQVQQHTAQLDTIVTETLATSEEMRATITETSRQAQAVADTAQQSLNVSKTGQDVVATTVSGMETIQRQVSDIATSILALSERTQQIGEIINAVEEIADQSRLLALNASIEAARAGEEGLGFAVVAREMRHLAGQSREATTRVSGILNEIQRAANTAVMVTEEGSKGAQAGMELARQAGVSIHDLAAIIEDSARIAIQIAASTRQQTNAMDQLVTAMKSIKQASAQTSASLKEANM